ncbi:phosphatidylinositol-4-phosphate 5-kinase fab1 [Ascosphaera apis ARSEF 7405]|uniref:1-phosphatidylinositol-3-phosphate 5-kinase n=1 Tax=Ascosphaera apis ARSEF 7405 TaxID=392613 RepID=A0A167YF23_9EURO|nr:phosphatidylinositol-4-phosphate 5-kinase fab1 [Ascosphaera apis ARSEF 7405]
MNSHKTHEASSPSASSIFLPLGRRSRKDSQGSANTQIDRDKLTEALDEIHTAASKSQELTVFNDFTNPPSPEPAEDKGSANGGLSGLYHRFFKSPLDGVKDIVGGQLKHQEEGQHAQTQFSGSVPEHHNDASPVQKSGGSGTVPQTNEPFPLKSAQESLLRLSLSSASPHGPEQARPPEISHSKQSLKCPSTSSKTSAPFGANHRSQSLPLNKIPPLTTATPSTTQLSVNVNAFARCSVDMCPQSEPCPDHLALQTARPQDHNDSYFTLDRSTLSPDRADCPEDISKEPAPDVPLHASRPSLTYVPAPDLLSQEVSSPYTALNAEEAKQGLDGLLHEGMWTTSSSVKPPRSDIASGAQTPLIRMSHVDEAPRESPLPRIQLGPSGPARASSLEVYASGTSTPVATPGIRPLDTLRRLSIPKKEVPQIANKLLAREFWMKDENAKDCFHCGEPFTTFRRKHHCRTCGQIFCSKCTHLISGVSFGQAASIRVCKPCEDRMIADDDDDSSDYSIDDMNSAVTRSKSFDRFPPLNAAQSIQEGDDDDTSSITMSISRRVIDPANRRSSELDPSQLSRPTSSRSLKSTVAGRSRSVHRRHHSRPQFIRNFRPHHDDSAPFQKKIVEEMNSRSKFSAFHRDSFIDPELTQYLSDNDSSEDAPSTASGADTQVIAKEPEPDKISLANIFAAVKKGRPRFGEKVIRNSEDFSSLSGKASPRLIVGKRNARMDTQRLSPRLSRELTVSSSRGYDLFHQLSNTPSKPPGGHRMTRSSSIRGATAPDLALNKASSEHIRKLLRQLLDDASVPHAQSWQTALIPILLKVVDGVDPDVQQGDDMDVRHYVKLKRILGGRPGDTSYVSGLVFTKNLALKSMPRQISRPQILLIAFPLEYARQEQHFMSLEPVIRQENEFLGNLVSRIAAFNPTLLLVEKTVSGRALELLSEANIATAYNVKPSVMEAVSRCTQAKIITSMNHLTAVTDPIGECGMFEVKTYVHDGVKRTYMYLYECSPELGCTLVLRGADLATLTAIKRIAEFMIYVVYNLKLETCLMRDEFANIPNPKQDELSSSVQDPTPKSPKREQAQKEGFEDPEPAFYKDMVIKFQTTILSASPYVRFKPPYLLMRARELERRLTNWKRLKNQDSQKLSDTTAEEFKPMDEKQEVEKMKTQKFLLVAPEMINKSLAGASLKQREVLHAVHSFEYERAYHNYQTQKRQWENISGNINMFDPYAHQNIVVLYSALNTKTFAPCVGPDIISFGFYDEHVAYDKKSIDEADCTLGQYVEHLCESANVPCEGGACEESMMGHHRRYVHGEGQIRVYLESRASKQPGLENTILMWNYCNICKTETPPVSMSPNTWKYSFAKYLELSFWSEPIHPRAGFCDHDLHRDYLRYFGYKGVAICVKYDPIDLLDLSVPSLRVTWKVELDLKLRNEVYTKAERRLRRFFSSVKARLDGINVDNVAPEKLDGCRQEIARLKMKASEDFSALLKKHQEQYMTSKYWEIIPLNRMIRAVQEKVVEWDDLFSAIEKNYFPSEKDIRRLATLQLKRFLDRGVSVSPGEGNLNTPSETDHEQSENHEMKERRTTRRLTLTPQQAKDVLVSVVEEDSGKISDEKQSGSPNPTAPIPITGERKPEEGDPYSTAATPDSLIGAVSPGQFSFGETNETSVQSRQSPIAQRELHLSGASSPQDRLQRRESNGPDRAGDVARGIPCTTPSKSPEPNVLPKAESFPGDKPKIGPANIAPLSQRTSAIPRPQEKARKLHGGVSPPVRRSPQPGERGMAHTILHRSGGGPTSSPSHSPSPRAGERKHLENPAVTGVKTAKFAQGHSMIPRSVVNTKKQSQVSYLSRHFEQLSREFEKERQRERQQRANSTRLSRAIPTRSSNPIVRVYKNVRDAVERDSSEDYESTCDVHMKTITEESPASLPAEIPEALRAPIRSRTVDVVPSAISVKPSSPKVSAIGEEPPEQISEKVEHPENKPDQPGTEDTEDEMVYMDDNKQEEEEELPKHERISLIKMLTNFWAERSSSGWSPLDYPLSTLDHVFEDSDIIVREDEPSSVIAFALNSEDYKQKLAAAAAEAKLASPTEETDIACEDDLLQETGTHLKFLFQESEADMMCKIFYAGQFDALRRKCGVSNRIVESLSRCMKWDSQGGKSQSLFLKTTDQRFILKSLSPMESQAFLKFAPGYFSIMSEVLFHELPSAIAKMFGFYQVMIKNPATDVDIDCYFLLMENLFYDQTPTRIFDLKGSMRNRKVESTGTSDEVLLDENMVEFIFESPLFTRSHSKKLLNQSVWNDTLFLQRQNVMDYSLMLAIDGPKNEMVVGVIDCIRTYTWDKKVESWIKGGGKNRPTIMGPREYKRRFRQAMATYILHAPDTWYHFQPLAHPGRPNHFGTDANSKEDVIQFAR